MQYATIKQQLGFDLMLLLSRFWDKYEWLLLCLSLARRCRCIYIALELSLYPSYNVLTKIFKTGKIPTEDRLLCIIILNLSGLQRF